MFWLILLLWGAWGILIACGWRKFLPRFVFRFERRWLSLLCTYASMAAMVAFSTWFLEFSGWNIKSLNEEPWQRAGTIICFLSPIGFPLIVGGPIVLFVDFWRTINEGFLEVAP